MPIFVRGNDSNLDGKLAGDGKGVAVGSTDTTGRNAGVGTARGTMIFNSTTDAVEIYTDGNEWKQVATVRGTGPGTKSDYPVQPSNIAVFTSVWPASPSDLPTSHANSTWTAPANAVEARVIVIGAAPYHPDGAPKAGKAAVVDALIPVEGGSSYKCIVGETGGGARPAQGGNGIGGGPGTDSNDQGCGGGGSGFFYAEPSATDDTAMFPKGVLISGAGGGGGTNVNAGNGTGPSPDPIGGFTGISRKSEENNEKGEGGGIGGIGGRVRHSDASLDGPNAARGEGGTLVAEGYPNCQGGTGGGAGGGGAGGGCPHSQTAGDSPNGRGVGYGGQNPAGAGRGGNHPMIGGNGFTFQGVDLGGGGGGSHGAAHAGGGWGGGGGAYYSDAGGGGGSGAWGYLTDQVSIEGLPGSGPPAISVNGGNLGANTPFPTTVGLANNNGGIIVMWYEPS